MAELLIVTMALSLTDVSSAILCLNIPPSVGPSDHSILIVLVLAEKSGVCVDNVDSHHICNSLLIC